MSMMCTGPDCIDPAYYPTLGLCRYHNTQRITTGVMTKRIKCNPNWDIETRLKWVGWHVTESGCWEWKGDRTVQGYGSISYHHKTTFVHRYSLALWGSGLKDNELACHTCDNPPCMNPEHLYAGSHKDNHRDMDARGRRVAKSGEGHWNHKITARQAEEIYLKRLNAIPVEKIKEEYGVSETLILGLKNGKSWKDLNLIEKYGPIPDGRSMRTGKH